MADPSLIIALLAAIGLFLVGLSAARLRRRRVLAATRSGLSGALCLTLAAVGFALALNLYTYQRLSYEQPVAHLRFIELGDQYYRAVLQPVNGPPRQLDLRGDEWQLDARVLKWRPLANLLGFDALFRLDRLSGRYSDVDAQRHESASAYPLADAEPGVSAWTWAQRLPRWAAFVDAQYGSATFLPMADNAEYDVALSQSGLLARPANAPARKAIRHW